MEKLDIVYNIYLLIKEGDIDNAKNEIKNLKDNVKNLRGLLSLKLRIFIHDKNDDEIYNLFENYEMMSRDWVDLLIYSNNNIDKILDKYIDKIININFNNKNITDLYENLLENNFIKFIKYFEYKQLIINKIDINIKYICKYDYYLEDLLENQIQIIKNLIIINNINDNYSYKYILDGGNILYSNNGKITSSSYNKLLKFYNFYKKDVLIILNKKHSNNINKNPKFKNVNILYTPYNINDDFYILYYSLINKAFIISNDEYSDHIDNYSVKIPNLNLLKVYLDEKLIKYNSKTNLINTTTNYTKVIQIIDNDIYIPTQDGYLNITNKIN